MSRTGDEIAIISMALRAPGARTVEEFWNNVATGVESRVAISDDELLSSGRSPEELSNPLLVKAAFPAEGIEFFDAEFFGMSPKEAAVKGPQARMCLELAWEALEAAGYDPRGATARTAVIIGVQPYAYLINNILPAAAGATAPDLARFVHQGNVGYGVPLGISYFFDLAGPSFSIDTACSSSLVATHLGCQAILNGDADMALVGGVSLDPVQSGG